MTGGRLAFQKISQYKHQIQTGPENVSYYCIEAVLSHDDT